MKVVKGETEVIFTLHAAFRAEERNVDGKTLRDVVNSGSFEKFGKNGIKIIRNAREGKIVLVGRFLKPNLIKILTVEKSGWHD